jgi:hypothetical protein
MPIRNIPALINAKMVDAPIELFLPSDNFKK